MNDRTYAACCHLCALPGLVFPGGGVLAAWLLWGRAAGRSSVALEHSREALNFQLTAAAAALISWLLVFSYVGLALLGLLVVFETLLAAAACRSALRGRSYRYPLCWRVIH